MTQPLPSAAELVARLRENDRAAQTGRRDTLAAWNTRVANGEWSAGLVADAAFLLLTTLTEEDGSLDMVAAELIQRHGEARHLDPLRNARPTLRPRVTLRDWRLEVDRAISLIQARTADQCECAAQAKHGASARNVGFEVQREHSDEDPYSIRYDVRCRRCGKLWLVTERHGYHYPLSYWSTRSE